MKNMTALDYAAAAADTVMNKYTASTLPPSDRFHYHQGVFLTGMEKLYEITGDKKYFDYIKAWADYNIKPDGAIPNCHLDEFDDMQPGRLLIALYDATNDERYKTALDTIIFAAERFPKNALGGVWHKGHCKNQMWLDCMYMMGSVVTEYALRFNEPYLIEVVCRQMYLMYENMKIPRTGLLYHAWDHSKKARWADAVTGCSPEHWGRALGWFTVAVTEIASMLPRTNAHKTRAEEISRELIKAVASYQDDKTGLWYQVVDKGSDSHNWLETSCGALFVYAMAKARESGITDGSFDESIQRGYEGVTSMTRTDKDGLVLDGVCVGTGVGDAAYYFSRPTAPADLHGMGAFLLMCAQIHKRSDSIETEH